MKFVPCSGPHCSARRVHHEQPDTPRGKPRMVEVSDKFEGKAFCSFECAAYAGAFKARTDTP